MSEHKVIRFTDELMASVTHVFERLVPHKHAPKLTAAEKSIHKALCSQHVSCLSAADTMDIQSKLHDLQAKRDEAKHAQLHHYIASMHTIKQTIQTHAPSLRHDVSHTLRLHLLRPDRMLRGHVSHTIALGWITQLLRPAVSDARSAHVYSNFTHGFYHASRFYQQFFFQSLRVQAKKEKASGQDNSNLFMFSLCPPSVQQWLFLMCEHFISHQMPHHWLHSYIHSLFKKGRAQSDQLSPNSSIKHNIQSNCNLPRICIHILHFLMPPAFNLLAWRTNHRCADHVSSVAALNSSQKARSIPTYMYFVDFNKVFNTVPHAKLWLLLEKFAPPPTSSPPPNTSSVGYSHGQLLYSLSTFYNDEE